MDYLYFIQLKYEVYSYNLNKKIGRRSPQNTLTMLQPMTYQRQTQYTQYTNISSQYAFELF